MRTYEVMVADLAERTTAVVRGHVSQDGIAEFLGSAFGEVMSAVGSQGLQVTGPPFGCYLPTGQGEFDVEAGFPVSTAIEPAGGVEVGTLPAGRVAWTLHHGPYDDVAAAYDALRSWAIENGYLVAGTPWESYLDDPDVPEPRTEVFLPCREPHR